MPQVLRAVPASEERAPRPAAPSVVPPGSLALRAVGAATGLAFGVASAVRGTKVFHPEGAVYEGTVEVDGRLSGVSAPLLNRPATYEAVIRFSRGTGLPEPLPDLLGMSVRLVEAHGAGRHQDLLLITSADVPALHHALLPARGFLGRAYTSSLPYRVGDRLMLLGAVPESRHAAMGGGGFARLHAAAATGSLSFFLAAAPVLGRFEPFGRLRIGERCEPAPALRFNPWNTGGGLTPAGILNRLRGFAYPGSQAGWTV